MTQPWITEYNALIAEATAIRNEAVIKFGHRDCWGNRIANRRADGLFKQAAKLQGKHKLGPPRFKTARFEQFMVQVAA